MNENVGSSSCYVQRGGLLRRYPLTNISHSRAAVHYKTERCCISCSRTGFSSKGIRNILQMCYTMYCQRSDQNAWCGCVLDVCALFLLLTFIYPVMNGLQYLFCARSFDKYTIRVVRTRRSMSLLCNNCCCGQAVRITYFCVCLQSQLSGNQSACAVFSSVACLAPISFREKVIEQKLCVLIFPATSARKVAVIRVRFQ